MKRNYRTREQVAMKLELESYKGNEALEKMYIHLLNSTQVNIDRSFITEDLKRVRGNMQYLKAKVNKLPEIERNFLYDVYIDKNLDIHKIMKKYGLKRSAYHRFLDKTIFTLANIER